MFGVKIKKNVIKTAWTVMQKCNIKAARTVIKN